LFQARGNRRARSRYVVGTDRTQYRCFVAVRPCPTPGPTSTRCGTPSDRPNFPQIAQISRLRRASWGSARRLKGLFQRGPVLRPRASADPERRRRTSCSASVWRPTDAASVLLLRATLGSTSAWQKMPRPHRIAIAFLETALMRPFQRCAEAPSSVRKRVFLAQGRQHFPGGCAPDPPVEYRRAHYAEKLSWPDHIPKCYTSARRDPRCSWYIHIQSYIYSIYGLGASSSDGLGSLVLS